MTKRRGNWDKGITNYELIITNSGADNWLRKINICCFEEFVQLQSTVQGNYKNKIRKYKQLYKAQTLSTKEIDLAEAFKCSALVIEVKSPLRADRGPHGLGTESTGRRQRPENYKLSVRN